MRLFTYDTRMCPPTYGDFLMVVMRAKYEIVKGRRVSFSIRCGRYRIDWIALNDEQREKLIKEYAEIGEAILKQPINIIRSESPYCDDRLPYISAFREINALCMSEKDDFLDKFLLNADEFAGSAEHFPEGQYVTLACRFNPLWGQERNLDENAFVQMNKNLERYTVMVVSDSVGCDHFKKVAREHDLPCLFSKDFSNSFLGDIELVLRSAVYIVYKGGGINMVPVFSRMPYMMTFWPGQEVPVAPNKLSAWASEEQYFASLN